MNKKELDKVLKEKYYALEKQGRIGEIGNFIGGDIPVLYSSGENLAEAWENSMIALWNKGISIRTQYDQKDSKGNFVYPPSIDSSMTMVVENPNSEPKIHKCFPAGLDTLEEYRQEVVDGLKNHWVRNPEDPNDNRWDYTYNQRLENYNIPGIEKPINQLEEVAQKLAKSPITRRANMITWQPWEDNNIGDPPCLQSLWGRIFEDEKGNEKLNMNIRFRSRDGYKAAFMNTFAFIDYANNLAKRISELRGKEVSLGRFVDQSDSFHIYGNDIEDFYQFANALVKRDFYSKNDSKSRTYRSDSSDVQEAFKYARLEIPKKIAEYDSRKSKE